MTDSEDDSDDEQGPGFAEQAKAAGERVGAGITNGIAAVLGAFASFIMSIFVGLMKPIPVIKNKVWKGLLATSLRQYHKAAGGDRLGLEVTPAGKMDLTPVKYRGPDQCEDDEQPGWKAKGRDKVWRPTTMGQDGYRMAKVPVVPLDSDSWKATNVLESRVAEAVDMGETRPLYNVESAELTATVEMDNGGTAAGAAVADGGAQVNNLRFDPRDSPVFQDEIIDLGSDDYDGQAVSFVKAKDLMLERTSTEEMDLHERRGEIAGRSGRDLKSTVIKLALISLAIVAISVLGEELMQFFFGGGGGGGESGGGGGGSAMTLFAPDAIGNLAGW